MLVVQPRKSSRPSELCLHGEQGSAKSTAARVLRELVDPNTAPLRSSPREPRDLMIAANNGWVIALDNLSYLPQWFSDALCRLSTGGGFATRELYTDQDEVIFDSQRPVIITGIEEVVTRGDLLDRSLLVSLPTIADEHRLPESKFWTVFNKKKSGLFGAMLTAVSQALANLPNVSLGQLFTDADEDEPNKVHCLNSLFRNSSNRLTANRYSTAEVR